MDKKKSGSTWSDTHRKQMEIVAKATGFESGLDLHDVTVAWREARRRGAEIALADFAREAKHATIAAEPEKPLTPRERSEKRVENAYQAAFREGTPESRRERVLRSSPNEFHTLLGRLGLSRPQS